LHAIKPDWDEVTYQAVCTVLACLNASVEYSSLRTLFLLARQTAQRSGTLAKIDSVG